jgi:hypothetical protein
MPPVVRLKLRVRLPDGSRPYLDPVYSANNKLKPGFAMHDGKSVHFKDGVYHLRYLKGSRRVWEGVGTDAQFALASKLKREKSLDAKAVGVNVVEDEPQATSETDLREVVAEYLQEVEVHKSKKTFAAYSLTLKLFIGSLADKSREENFDYSQTLEDPSLLPAMRLRRRAKPLSQRWNKFSTRSLWSVWTFALWTELRSPMIAGRRRPPYRVCRRDKLPWR